jgi:tetratricopeptide (TPR) repeat protein/predicted Ser/Thr protein kinase
MGDVYYAEDTTLRRPVALKRVTNELGSDPHARQRILQEARRASALSSEHIAAVHDVLAENGELFLVMEYVEGETLRQRLQRPITLEQFFEIARQCAEALKAAHEHGIVHCDIKPENIMLTPTGQVKILDFGLAKHLPRSDKSSTLASGLIGGTPAYMAPEVLLEKLPDARSDIFSLGVVLYEMLTLKNPFFTGSFVATSERILHDTPAAIRVLNPNVPEALEAVIMRAMAKTTAQRYANACELLDDLRRVQAGSLPMELTPAVIRGEGRSGKLWLVTAVVLVVAAAFIFATYRWTHRQSVLAERGWVLISDFETAGDETIPDKGVREGLTIALQQSRYVNVFPRSRAYETLERMKKGDAPQINEALGREICQRENLRVLLTGSIERMGQTFQISVRGLDPARGNVLFAEHERFDRKDQFFDKVDSLAKAVRTDLGESLVGIQGSSRPLAKVTTSSLEALQLYSQALDLMAHGRPEQAPPFLQSALARDSNFAMAHLRLGECYSAVIGKNEKAVSEFQRAYDLRQTVTDRERLWIEGQYEDVQESYELSAQSFAVLAGLYPDDAEARQELAQPYDNLGQLDSAIAEQRRALALNPDSLPGFRKLILWLARNNQNDEAVRAYETASQRGVESPYLRWGLGMAYLGRGQLSEARDQFQRMSQGSATERQLGQTYAAVADLYEGKLRAAEAKLVVDLPKHSESRKDLSIVRRDLLGRIRLMQGDLQGAQRQAELILATPLTDLQTIDFRSAGSVFAAAGNPGRARQVMHKLATICQQTPTGWNNGNFHYLEGEILLTEGKPTEALIAFQAAVAEYPEPVFHLGLARAYQRKQDWTHASQELEQFLQARGNILQRGFPPDLALAHFELARVDRRMNDFPRAQFHYQQFLATWRQADDLPTRQLAARELEQLRHHR